MEVPLYVICRFSLVAFSNFSLSLIFASLIIVSWRVSPWVYSVWHSLRFLGLGGYFLSLVREVFDYNLFTYFLWSFLSLFSFWDPYNANVVVFNVPEVS